jgi:hypothetical protein
MNRAKSNRTGLGAGIFLLVLAALVIVTAGTAQAAQFSATLNGTFPIHVHQGETVTDAFYLSLSASGNFPSSQNGYLRVCSEITIDGSGIASCTAYDDYPLTNSNPPTGFPSEAYVDVVANENAPCDQTYNTTDVMFARLFVSGGADFGNGVTYLNFPVAITVDCAEEKEQGCSHGYWKNHLDAWGANYAPTDFIFSVFPDTVTYGLEGDTLEAALSYTGGPTLTDAAKLLLLQAVAAVLNADSGDVDFPMTVQEVKDAVEDALKSQSRAAILELAATLDGYNNLVCPLD